MGALLLTFAMFVSVVSHDRPECFSSLWRSVLVEKGVSCLWTGGAAARVLDQPQH